MQIVQPTLDATLWYRTAGNPVIKTYDGFLPLGTTTQKWTYTVPVFLDLWVTTLVSRLMRYSPASVLSYAYAYFQLPISGVDTPILFHYLLSNAVGDTQTLTLNEPLLLRGGQTISYYVNDNNADGQVLGDSTLIGTPFT